MTSLFRSIVSNKRRDSYFKNEIIKELNNCIKEVQAFPPNSHNSKLTTNEETNALCTTLEALFLHGLRETILSKMSAMTSDIIKKPECNFWSIVLIFSHPEIISNINLFKLITNDIGRCRAWLRLAINDSLLVSYLSMMSSDPKSLAAFYNKTALLRDTEKLDIAINLLQGIIPYEFNLVVNSSLLNIWSDDSLILSGVWSPPMKAAPISSGKDVVKTIKDEIEDSLGSVLSLSSFASIPVSSHDIDEDAALKIILQTPDVSSSKIKNDTLIQTSEDYSVEAADVKTVKPIDIVENKGTQKELKSNTGKSPNDEQTKDKEPSENEILSDPLGQEKNSEMNQGATDDLNSADNVSFTTLLRNYKENNRESIEDIENGYNIDELLNHFQAKHRTQMPEPPITTTAPPTSSIPEDQEGDFEFVHASESPLDMPEFTFFAQCLTKLTREKDLRVQNYSCKQCFSPIGINFTFFCCFTSDYFCEYCFDSKSSVIPARIVYNWDFSPRPVSKNASVFLSDIHNHPVFNVKLLNPRLYLLVDHMTQVHYMRKKLNYIKAYLLSCKSTANYLQVELWPREYLYESLHLYSLLDLKEIHSGKLQILLNHVIAFGSKHIVSCSLCKLKGHICELCKAGHDVLFPFDLERTHTCRACRATFHKACYQGECPKCCRIQKRKRELALTSDVQEGCEEISESVERDSSEKVAYISREKMSGAISNHMDGDGSIESVVHNSQTCDVEANHDSNDDSVSIDEDAPRQIECIAEVHSEGSS